MIFKVTLEEANNYVKNIYMSTEKEYIKWAELSEENKQVILNRGASIINSLGLIVSKDIIDTPNKIKEAIIEETLYILVTDFNNKNNGIKSESIAGVSVTYDYSTLNNMPTIVLNLIRGYRYGHYEIF